MTLRNEKLVSTELKDCYTKVCSTFITNIIREGKYKLEYTNINKSIQIYLAV